jgi:hypothetical protein
MGHLIFGTAMSGAARQARYRARQRGLIPAWVPKGKPKPPQMPDCFLEGLVDLDDLGLREFDVVRPWAHSPSKIPAKS